MYIYLIQPLGSDSNVYKIGMSKRQNLDRLKSYPKSTRYIRFAEIGNNYKRAESELIKLFNENFTLHSGKEYFIINSYIEEIRAINIFNDVCDKYFQPLENNEKNKVDEINNVVKRDKEFVSKNILHEKRYVYECKLCKISTSNKYDYNKHLNTSKHKKLCNSDIICKNCFKSFSNKFNKNRHETKCSQQTMNNKIINNGNGSASVIGDNAVINNSPTIITLNIPDGRTISLETEKISNVKKKSTDKLDRIILQCMIDSKKDANSFIDRFDKDMSCQLYKKKEDDKVPAIDVLECLKYALMNSSDDIVIHHKITNLSGQKVYMFKTGDVLCYKEFLEVFFNKSKYKDNIDIDKCIQVIESDSAFNIGYSSYYKALRFKAKKLLRELN